MKKREPVPHVFSLILSSFCCFSIWEDFHFLNFFLFKEENSPTHLLGAIESEKQKKVDVHFVDVMRDAGQLSFLIFKHEKQNKQIWLDWWSLFFCWKRNN